MGIDINVASAIAREHAWRAIHGNVLLLGRQTMLFTPRDAIEMMRAEGIEPPSIEFGIDDKTRLASSGNIRDDDFFTLLGINKIKAIDVSDYEGADIIHDLTTPLPAHLEGIADFILDGSTLDNVFDPAMALRNIAKLLRPGGRLISINVGSNHYGPYTIPTCHWLLDYFVYNAFVDCKVYAINYYSNHVAVFTPNLNKLTRTTVQPDNFKSGCTIGIVVVAEKGLESTWDKNPVQHQYRSSDDWDIFDRNLVNIKKSKRPDMLRSISFDPLRSVPELGVHSTDDYYFVDSKGKLLSYSSNSRFARSQSNQFHHKSG